MTQKSRFLFTTESSGEIAKPTELIAPAMSSYFSHDARTVRHMIWAVDIEHSENSAQKNAFSLVHSTVHSHTARQNYLCRETRIIVFMQISGWTFKLERARDNVMKVEKMERRNIKSKNRRFFFECVLLLHSASTDMAVAFIVVVRLCMMMNRFHCVNWSRTTNRRKKICVKQFQVCWYDSLYLQAISHGAHTERKMRVRESRHEKTNERVKSLEIESIHVLSRTSMCVCAESITNNNDSRRKFVHVFFGSAIVSGLWNLVHRSTDILVFLSTSLYLLSLALTLFIVSFQFLPLLFLFLVFIRWPNHVPFGLLTFDWIGQHSFRKTMWHLRYL